MATTKTKMSKIELQKYIISEAMKYVNNGDPIEHEMNKNDASMNNDGSKETKSMKDVAPDVKLNFVEKTDQKDVKMDQNDKNQGQVGKDNKPESLVQVGEHTETKTHADAPDAKTSQPYTEVIDKDKIDMNSMDKEGDMKGEAHAVVQPGSEVKSGFKTGGHNAEFKDSAKTVNDKEKMERIAKGIQLPERFENKKALLEFIEVEAKKLLTSLK
jgi:hypothetical protein